MRAIDHPSGGGGETAASRGLGRVRWAAIAVIALMGVSVLGTAAATSAATTSAKELSVDLSTVTGPADQVAQGILYGLSQDATQPADQYLEPIALNSYRGGGWGSGGWLGDGYTFGTRTQTSIDMIIAQATRLKAASPDPDNFHYEVLLSDIWGSYGGTPASAQWPCKDGNCSNWISFLQQTIAALEASGIDFRYEFWNEGDLSIFWRPGVNNTQYFQMWDTGYQTIRTVAPDALIVGPSFAATPERNPSLWRTWLQHVKAANTVPDWISNHLLAESGVPTGADDPVVVSQKLRDLLDEVGIAQRPLSANEYQGVGIQTANVTAWYINRFAYSTYDKAMRANWNCCLSPNLTGILNRAQTGWAPTGSWWSMRFGAEMTGETVQTSRVADKMSISAAKDATKQQAVALLGDLGGYTGSANVTFTGLDAAPYLVRNGKVHATVYGISEGVQYAPIVQFTGDLTVAADGSVKVPAEFVKTHDAAVVYLSWTEGQSLGIQAPATLVPGNSYDVPVTVTNGAGTAATEVATSLAVTADDPSKAAGITVTCVGGAAACPTVANVAAGASTTATFRVSVPSSAPTMSYRLVGTATLVADGTSKTVSNSVDLVGTCVTGVNCEAENGQLTGGTCVGSNHAGYTGTGFVACFDTSTPGRGITQKFSVETAGTYTLDLRYAAGPHGPYAEVARTATVTANGTSVKATLPATGAWASWAVASVAVDLVAGANDITVSMQAGDTGWFNLDHLKLTAPAPAGPDVTVDATTRCVAGKVVVVVTAANASQGAATITTSTPYGPASFGSVAAGKTVTKALSTRAVSIPAATLSTTATAAGTTTVQTQLDAANCGG